MLINFDLDGVLLDSKPCMEAAWAAVQEEIPATRCIPFESYFANIGRPFWEILQLVGCPSNVAEKVEKVYFEASMSNKKLNVLYPDVFHILTELKGNGHDLVIVTSKKHALTCELLSDLGILAMFKQVICPDGLGSWVRGKPAPDSLWYSMIVTKHDINDTLFIGDMPVDQECAKRAGVRFLHARWGYGEWGSEELGHPISAHDPMDLLRKISRVGNTGVLR